MYSQRLTKQFVAWGAKYFYTEDIKTSFSDATFTGDGFIVFGSETDLISGLETLSSFLSARDPEQVTGDPETVTDLGKELKVGILGGISDILTYRLVQRTSLGPVSANGIPASKNGDTYGKCWVLTNSRAINSLKLSDNSIGETRVTRL